LIGSAFLSPNLVASSAQRWASLPRKLALMGGDSSPKSSSAIQPPFRRNSVRQGSRGGCRRLRSD
jgi:hypothetical protein